MFHGDVYKCTPSSKLSPCYQVKLQQQGQTQSAIAKLLKQDVLQAT